MTNALLQQMAQGGGFVSPMELHQMGQQVQQGQQRNMLFQQQQEDRQRGIQAEEQQRINSEILNAAAPMLMPGVTEEQAAALYQQTAPAIKQKYPHLQVPDQYPGRQALVGMLPLPQQLRDKLFEAALAPKQQTGVPGDIQEYQLWERQGGQGGYAGFLKFKAGLAPQARSDAKPNLVAMPDPNSPTGFSFGTPTPGAPATPPRHTPRLPPGIQKSEDEDLEAINIASGIDKDLGSIAAQLDAGGIELGPVDNMVSGARNWAGVSTEQSRNFASMKATLEKLRNDSLRLNKGVQTEGDAVRAWNELLANLNDAPLVKQRIEEIQNINRRGMDLRQALIENRRRSYASQGPDTQNFEAATPAVGAGKPQNKYVRTGMRNGKRVGQLADGTIEEIP